MPTMSDEVLNVTKLTMEEKEKLTKDIDKLPGDKLNRVVEIVQEEMELSGFQVCVPSLSVPHTSL